MVDMLSSQLDCNIYPVHRLDTTTTGLMVFAKNEKSAGILSSDIASRNFHKHYLAICHGSVDKAGEMRDFLFHDRIKNKSFAVESISLKLQLGQPSVEKDSFIQNLPF